MVIHDMIGGTMTWETSKWSHFGVMEMRERRISPIVSRLRIKRTCPAHLALNMSKPGHFKRCDSHMTVRSQSSSILHETKHVKFIYGYRSKTANFLFTPSWYRRMFIPRPQNTIIIIVFDSSPYLQPHDFRISGRLWRPEEPEVLQGNPDLRHHHSLHLLAHLGFGPQQHDVNNRDSSIGL